MCVTCRARVDVTITWYYLVQNHNHDGDGDGDGDDDHRMSKNNVTACAICHVPRTLRGSVGSDDVYMGVVEGISSIMGGGEREWRSNDSCNSFLLIAAI